MTNYYYFFLIIMLKLKTVLCYQFPYRLERYLRFHSVKISSDKFLSKEMKQHQATQSDHSFWSEGLKFSCTGCGKCCQTEGLL